MNKQGCAGIRKDFPGEILVKRTAVLRAVVGLTLALPLLVDATPSPAQGCQPVLDAMNKIYTTPTHLYNTMDGDPKSGDKPRKNELIYLGGVVYSNYGGKWARSKVTLEQVMKLEENNRRNSKTSCRYLRDESVNGEMSAVYSTHAERTDALTLKSDGQFWISKSKGLPLRHEEDIDADGIKNHHSTRYEYTGVQAPVP